MERQPTAVRTEHLMIHLPTDVITLRKLVKKLFMATDTLQMPIAEVVYNLYVTKRSETKSKKKVEISILEGKAAVPALSKEQMKRFKGEFARVFVKHPGVELLGTAVYEELRLLGYQSFTYNELIIRVVKKLPPNIPSRKAMKPFVYALLDDSKYYRTMSYNHATKKPEIKFSLGQQLI